MCLPVCLCVYVYVRVCVCACVCVFVHMCNSLPSSSTVTLYALQADPNLLVALQLYNPESEGLAWVNTIMSVEAITYTPLSVLSAVILK